MNKNKILIKIFSFKKLKTIKVIFFKKKTLILSYVTSNIIC